MTKRRPKLDREEFAAVLKAAFDIAQAGPQPECFDALLKRIK